MADLKPPMKQAPKKVKPNQSGDGINKTIADAKPIKPVEQTPPDSIKPLQLKVPESKKNEFKAYAAMRGRSMNALFLDMFEEHKNKHA